MALFTDGPPASIEDLVAQDSQLLSVTNAEGIDVTQKLRLAHDELGMELFTLLNRMNYVDPLCWLAPKPNLETVAVTTPVKLWHTFRTLEMVYGDAYNSQLNDRYAGKRDQYHEKTRWAYEKVVQNGLGIVELPVARAETPVVTATAGAAADGTYYVTMTWVNRTGAEGSSAAPAVMTTAGSTMAVSPANSAPENATGWNVYVGLAPDSLVLQNQSVIAAGETWIQPNELVTAGRNPGCGQKPSYLRPIPRVIERG